MFLGDSTWRVPAYWPVGRLASQRVQLGRRLLIYSGQAYFGNSGGGGELPLPRPASFFVTAAKNKKNNEKALTSNEKGRKSYEKLGKNNEQP